MMYGNGSMNYIYYTIYDIAIANYTITNLYYNYIFYYIITDLRTEENVIC